MYDFEQGFINNNFYGHYVILTYHYIIIMIYQALYDTLNVTCESKFKLMFVPMRKNHIYIYGFQFK